MGKNEWGSLPKRNTDKTPMNPLALFLAFIFGAAVTAFVAVWRIRAAKSKKDGGADNKDSARANRELKELIKELRRGNESRRLVERQREEKSGDGAYDAKYLAISVPAQQIKPYRPRKRVSLKKFFGRATAVVAAAALVLTGLYMAPYGRATVPEVLARESFGGIKQVVEEHDEDNPFVILDIVPGKAYAEINGNRYDFSLGTIGYLAPGQSPIQQDLSRIFTGKDKESFYDYADRKKLTDLVIANGYSGITFQEAYGGTGENLKSSVWTKIFDPAEVKHDENGKLTNEVPYPTGRLYARVEKRADGDTGVRSGYDYNLTGQPAGGTFSNASAMTVMPAEGIYTFAEGGAGDYEVIFEGPEMGTSGYRAEVIKSGSYDEVVLDGSYSDATGVYIVENGGYRYACTIGEFKGIPRPEPKPEKPEKPTDPENPKEPTEPEEPTEPTEPENPEESTEPTEPETPEEPTEPTERE
ncbi:MAG: hypothetical protein K2M20_06180, partial [Lachnospiraceae bacterium]|nr:hypothetical protein [Lachnospiraceae bacterium]